MILDEGRVDPLSGLPASVLLLNHRPAIMNLFPSRKTFGARLCRSTSREHSVERYPGVHRPVRANDRQHRKFPA